MSEEHHCKFEREIAVLQKTVQDTERNTTKILEVLQGNGGDGLVTRVSKHDDSIKSLKNTRTWIARVLIGGFITGLISLCYFVLRTP